MPHLRTASSAVRFAFVVALVAASAAAAAQGRFKISADGQEVTDTTTRLVWKRCAEGMRFDGKACTGKPDKLSFKDAVRQGSGGWRVPTRDEWSALLDPDPKKRPRLDATAFPQSPALPFWARRPGSDDDLNQWLVSGSTGRVTGNVGQKKFALRLVKSA